MVPRAVPAAGFGASEVPHFAQKLVPSTSSAPQCGQNIGPSREANVAAFLKVVKNLALRKFAGLTAEN
jgi:hypothetical protein